MGEREMNTYSIMIENDKVMCIRADYVKVHDGVIAFYDLNKVITASFTIANIKGFWKI